MKIELTKQERADLLREALIGTIDTDHFKRLFNENDIQPIFYIQQESHDINSVQAGDIVRYGNNAHSVWVLSRDGDYVQVAECNYDLNCTVRWYQTKTLSELNNGLTYIYKGKYDLSEVYSLSSRNQNVASREQRTKITYPEEGPYVSYRTHVENIGWQSYRQNGTISGTNGMGLRLEGIDISINNSDINGGIEYSTHIQNIGWQDYVKDGAMSGTEGLGLRLEGIKIRLTGDIAKQYDVVYRVHCQNIGWMDWKRNNEFAGTSGLGYRLEAIQIKLEKKATPSVESYEDQSVQLLKYQTHVQNVGWQDYVKNGAMSGTEGRSLRLEGIKINLNNKRISGNIEYSTHVQNIGWQNFVKNGSMSGTEGRSLRLEGIKIRLTGDLADKYDIYYRVHSQNIGWMGWAKNGEPAGTAGFSYRLEGIQIVVVNKGDKTPGSTANCFVNK